jgi:hypothetical protein
MIIFLLLFGIGFTVLVGNVLSDNDAPPIMSLVFYLFMTMWIGTALFMLIYHLKNLKSIKGVSLFDINSETGLNDKNISGSPLQRLRDLESLKKEGLINDEEYVQKRAQILEDKW